MSVYSKLLELQKSARALKKDGKAYNYNYLTGDKLLSVIRPKMDELGLILMPEVQEVKVEPVNYIAFKDRQQYTKTEMLYQLSMTMTWVDTETGETLTQKWAGSGMNDFDKGFGSAITYGERYYLMKLFHLQTDADDVDAVSTERDKEIEAQMAKAAAELQAAGAPKMTQRKKFSPEEYGRAVISEAKCIRNKAGKTARDIFLETNPSQDEIKQFDIDVKLQQQALTGIKDGK